MDTVSTTSTLDSETGVEKQVSRVKAYTPFKKPKAQFMASPDPAKMLSPLVTFANSS